jgi:hypothetical protein
MTTTDYDLTDAELPAIRQFLSFQSTFGPGIRPLVPSDYSAYCDAASLIDTMYPQIQNPIFQKWMDEFFGLLAETPTNAVPGLQLAFRHMFVVYAYSQASDIHADAVDSEASNHFPVRASTWKSDMWIPFTSGYTSPSLYDACYGPWQGNPANGGGYLQVRQSSFRDNHVPRRPSSPVWKRATDEVLQSWDSNPPAQAISRASGPTTVNDNFNRAYSWALPSEGYVDENGAHYTFDPDIAWTDGANVVAFETQILGRWADFPDVQATTAQVWSDQTDMAKTLLRQRAISGLSASQYFFLLNVLLAMTTGSGASQRLAKKVAEAQAPSKEFANHTFSDQLIYLLLMDRANPLGNYAYPSPQLQQFLTGISNTVPGSDPASQAIKAALDRNLKILHSDPSYPMQDPYAPSVGLDSRLSHTLDALDAARVELLPPA